MPLLLLQLLHFLLLLMGGLSREVLAPMHKNVRLKKNANMITIRVVQFAGTHAATVFFFLLILILILTRVGVEELCVEGAAILH